MNVEDALAKLMPVPIRTWAEVPDRPIPEPGDDQREEALERYLASDIEWRAQFETGLTRDTAQALESFGERACTIAIRKQDPHWLELAVLALALAATKTDDRRDVLVRMPLPFLSAKKLGVNGEALYRRAVAVAPQSAREYVEAFLSRLDIYLLPENMLFREAADRDGFRWQRVGTSREEVERYLEALRRASPQDDSYSN